MKKFLALTVIVSSAFLLITAFGNSEKQRSTTIYQRHQQRFDTLMEEVKYFITFLPDNNTNEETLKASYLRMRASFKSWEYLANYLDDEFVKVFVNGAPLPKLVPNMSNLEIAEPRGLQVLDELLYTGNFSENKNAIVDQIKLLSGALNQYRYFKQPIYDRIVLEAARIELVRMYTLGLTGFDVPASGNSIYDAITVLTTLREDLLLYEDLFKTVDKDKTKLLYQLFDTYIAYLEQHNDFDNLDRLFILRDFVNPLLSTLYDLHLGTGIEMIHEVRHSVTLPPYNHHSKNLFANDFLDHNRYIQLPELFDNGATINLGRTLFFDPVLSSNLKRSCASCHHPDKAFTDGISKSTALSFEGTVDRNAPTLVNCVYSERFFHDMRAEALEDQVEHVLVNRKEFDTDMIEIVSKLKQSDEYVKMFEQSFDKYPGEKLNSKTIQFALSAYVSSLRGFNSEFDKYVRGETNTATQSVRNGYNLFMGKAVCGTCHFAPVFNGTVPPLYEESETEVLGVPADPYTAQPVLDNDLGRYDGRMKERAEFYKFSFKTPTVRNAALTAPYMHNGAYKTMDDVVDFYNKGGGVGLGIKLEHQTLPFDSLSLNKQEMKDLVAFMNALTDTTGMTAIPEKLPVFADKPEWNNRKIGGEY